MNQWTNESDEPMSQGAQKGNQKILRNDENPTTIYQNIEDAAKAMLRGKCIATNLTLKK